MKLITIFTPTYNRAYILEKLYNSLVNQTNKNFEWLIIDDGSTDNTKELIKNWINERKINVKYFYQENQGKQMAFNNAVQNSEGEYFFCVDSDDFLISNAIELVNKEIKKIDNDNEISGIIALRGKDKDHPLGTYMPKKIEKSSLKDLYEIYKFKGDTALIYKTKILKDYPFVLYNNEKFIGENYVYDQIDEKYKMIILNKIIYIGKYLEDGYTKNTIKLLKNNPYSYMQLKLQSSRISKKIYYKIKHMSGYIAMGLYIKEEKKIRKSNNLILAIISFPIGILVYILRFRDKKN